jgi:hypothetical protein
MSKSTDSASITAKKTGRPKKDVSAIGLCLKCGHRVTLCGKPFTAEIPCCNCLFINIFNNSQQPVSGRW